MSVCITGYGKEFFKKAKKYSRVSAHMRNVGHSTILVRSHIRKNPRFKEMKMEDPKTSEGTDAREEQTGGHEVRVDGRKTPKLTQVSVVMFYADNHYLASFNHAPRRVFHNMTELSTAIEVECEKLK